MVEQDKWRHVRAVLAARTPDSELLAHRAGGEIVAVVGEKAARVLVLRVPEGIPQARADADLDALSTLWNVADELLADAERGARTLATERSRERRRVARLRDALAYIAANQNRMSSVDAGRTRRRRVRKGATMDTEQRTTPEQLAEGRRLLAAASPGRWYAEHERDGEWTINADHWPDVDDEDAAICLGTFWMCGEHDARATAWLRNAAPALLAGARAEIGRLRAALATIQQWDCLNPPNTGLCADFPWLRELVDTALGTEGASE